MAVSNAVEVWSLTIAAGSEAQYSFTLSVINPTTGQSTPFNIAGATWEYIVRSSPADTTPGGVFEITTTANAAGVLVVTSTATLSQVQLTIYSAATATLAPGQYYHALWMNPGASNQYAWVSGTLTVVANPQP